MAAKKKPLSKGRIQKLAANPGTRAALADKYLNPTQLKQRQLNQRLNAPVVDGSSLTNRELAHQRDAAVNVEYAPTEQVLNTKLGQSKQLTKDTAGWYQEFQNQVNKLKGDVASSNAQQNTANANLVGAVGQLGSQTAVGDGGVRSDADKASAVRQALSGSFGAMMAAKGSNQADYAANLADVVAPGQKLSALNQSAKATGSVQDQLAALAREKGAFGSKFMSDTVAGEAKNVLANKALGLDISKAATQAEQNSPAGKGAAAAATSEATTASKYGYSVHDWRTLGPDGRSKVIKASKSKPADSVYSSGPFAGRKKSEIDAMAAGGRQTLVDRYDKTKGPGGKSPYLGTSQQTTFKTTFESTRTMAGKYKDQYSRQELSKLLLTGRPAQTVYVDKNGKLLPDVTDLTTAHKQGGHAIKLPAVPKVSNSAAISAALDAIYDGHLSAATIRKLHAAGIKVNGLGVSTKPPKSSKIAGDALSSVGQILGGIGT